MRVAIVGLGRWGRMLVNAGHRKGLEFVAGQTRTRASAEEFCAERGIALVDDYEAIVADARVEGVVLATPHSQHGEQVRLAARAGKHVFVEKPFTLTHADASSAIEAMHEAGKVLAVGFNRRFHPNMIELCRRAQAGELGKLAVCTGTQTSNFAPVTRADNWRSSESEAPAGAMTAIGVHTLDSMISIFGEVAEVFAVASNRGGAHADDTTVLLLRFASGATGTIYCSLSTALSYRFSVYGSDGIAEIVRPTQEELHLTPAVLPTDPPKPAEVISRPGFDTLHAELNAFAEAARGGAPYPVPLAEVLHGVAVFEAIVRSAAEGRAVMI
jgi:predicted dehydrogenase